MRSNFSTKLVNNSQNKGPSVSFAFENNLKSSSNLNSAA